MVGIYESIIFDIRDSRTNDTYEYYKKLAAEKCEIEELTSTIKRKKHKKMFIDDGPGSDDSNSIDFKVTTYIVILDKIMAELKKRKQSYHELFHKYQFLMSLTTITSIEVRKKGK